jgi:hypothetical protein
VRQENAGNRSVDPDLGTAETLDPRLAGAQASETRAIGIDSIACVDFSEIGLSGPPLPMIVQFPIADESTDFSAERRWLAYSRRFGDAVTDNVWCTRCRKAVRILRYTVHPKPGGIALVGTCAACGNQVFRYIGDNE